MAVKPETGQTDEGLPRPSLTGTVQTGVANSGAAFTERGQQHVFSASDVDRCRHGCL
jgi:hypothetical protein